jgi:ABC-2 type transport system ATP-binding protein
VKTKQPITSLHEIKRVHDIEQKDQTLSFQVDTEGLDSVMQYVSQFGLVKLESSPPTLEDLFMRHYEESGNTSNTGVGGES